MPWMTLGRHSYCKQPYARGEPIVKVGNYSAIASPCTFVGKIDHPSVNSPDFVSNYPFNNVSAGMSYGIDYPKSGGRENINIGNDVWTGLDCTFRGGITIGDGVIIGMKSVVAKDIPPYAVAVGNPCVVKKYRFSKEIIASLLKIKWWDWPHELIIKRIEDFKDINKFVDKYAS